MLDVALCMLLVSASVLLVAAYLSLDDDGIEPELADQTAQTIGSSTTTVEYSIADVADDSDVAFENAHYDDAAYERVTHGTLAELLTSAVAATVRVDGERVSEAGTHFAAGVDRNVQGELTGASENTQIWARWEPYDGATIESELTVGNAPPSDADVSSVTKRVPSQQTELRDDEVSGLYDVDDRSFEPTADLLAERIVDSYFPERATTVALQSDDLERDLAVYRYLQFGAAADDALTAADLEEGAPLNRSVADVKTANERLASNLSTVIEADLEDAYQSDVEGIIAAADDDAAAQDELDAFLAEELQIGDVTLTVQTWE
ncbi:hypothetical protein C493_10015 [Natronolimnohabitans innermongolicus JCM 12255]|uniref:Uncharacterized protein n=1 Tax=Natronolimnohabitans innermongolicus JCM 12255 TaxID=1227499 RepID=L9X5F9_9EURY|nr:hypothetical protein C493_10015 [Natronolimnohabitans innermongolicus JCM 12255]